MIASRKPRASETLPNGLQIASKGRHAFIAETGHLVPKPDRVHVGSVNFRVGPAKQQERMIMSEERAPTNRKDDR